MKRFFKSLLVIILFSILLIILARYVGTNGFITKEYKIETENIPLGFDGLKIVHFSDLHYNRAINTTKIQSIVDEINLINPDIVVFTGDLIDKDATLIAKDYDNLTKLLTSINATIGKYAIIGNHDYIKAYDQVKEVYKNSNFKYLENSSDIIYNSDNEKIFIGGLNTFSYGLTNVNKTLSPLEDESFEGYKIVLAHEPDIADQIVANHKVDLILAGHSHNGQIRFPIIGAIYKPPYAKKYYDNYYKIGTTDLYVSSGIGVSTLNYRLFNKPSINFYRINKIKSYSDEQE